jgi:hypothetical protein
MPEWPIIVLVAFVAGMAGGIVGVFIFTGIIIKGRKGDK